MHSIHLFYNKTIVDLCFGRHRVSIWRLVFNNTPCPPQHKSIIVLYNTVQYQQFIRKLGQEGNHGLIRHLNWTKIWSMWIYVLIVCSCVCLTDIMNRKARLAWELYLKMETSGESFSLLQLIANDCYKVQYSILSAASHVYCIVACWPGLGNMNREY